MSEPPQIGRSAYNGALARARLANMAIEKALDTLAENPGPETRAVLISKITMALYKNEMALSDLEKIGRTAKQRTAID